MNIHITIAVFCFTFCQLVFNTGQCYGRDIDFTRDEILQDTMENVTKSAIDKNIARTQTCTCTPAETFPRDCLDVMNEGNIVTNIYTVYPDGPETNGFDVRCDMDTGSGGWNVIQRRVSATDFYKSWEVYKDGFGELHGSYWLGNDNIFSLCRNVACELRIDMKLGNAMRYAEYGTFVMADENDHYRLHVSEYTGNAGNAFATRNNNHEFSTFDRDNDDYSRNCAALFHGAWWYDKCHFSNLNGDYGNTGYAKGLTWNPWTGYYRTLAKTEMKVRRVN